MRRRRSRFKLTRISVILELVEDYAMTTPVYSPQIRVRSYRRGDAPAFRSLNEHWIAKYFRLEDPDREVLDDPEKRILGAGGAVFMAVAGDTAIGTCALLAEGDHVYELAKMAVDEAWQGRGVGRTVLEFAVAEARRMGARLLKLESSSKLKNAIHLYEAVGFRHLPPERIHPSPYERADIFMEMEL
jgi:putative acetyltransferase